MLPVAAFAAVVVPVFSVSTTYFTLVARPVEAFATSRLFVAGDASVSDLEMGRCPPSMLTR